MLGLMRGRAALAHALPLLLAGATLGGCTGYATDDPSTSAGPPSTQSSASSSIEGSPSSSTASPSTVSPETEAAVREMARRLTPGRAADAVVTMGVLSPEQEGDGLIDDTKEPGMVRGRVVCSGATVRITVAGASKQVRCDGRTVHEVEECSKEYVPEVRIERAEYDSTVTPFALDVARVGDC